MKELIYTVLDLGEWNKRATCDFCSSLNKAICEIRTRSKITDKIVASNCACESCKEKFENDELPKCDSCNRLHTKSGFYDGKYICRCIRNNEIQEKELPILPVDRRPGALYERQINDLQKKLNDSQEIIELEREAHEDFMKTSEEWGKRQKQELLDQIKELEIQVSKLTQENKKLKEKNKVETYEKEIENLKKQLEQLSNQQVSQIKEEGSKFKHFFSKFNK